MMKRFVSILLILLAAIPAMAETVSVGKATAAAAAFFDGKSATRASATPKLVWTGEGADTRSSSDPAFYVFNFDGGGFVVIAGDDAARPILGYSETGSFSADNLPSNIRGWFDGYASQVKFIRRNHLGASAETSGEWAAVLEGKVKESGSKKELKTPTWGQSEPFNDNCPEVDGKKSVTGCVSTAMSEIMRYHRWPESATGKVPEYKYTSDLDNEITIPEHQFSGTYNWNLMPETYFVRKDGKWYKNYNDDQAKAVAAVMEDVGKMLQSKYNSADSEAGTSGTGATPHDVPLVLVRYMKYDSTALFRQRDDMKYKEWTSLLKKEIDAGRPVCYSGSGENGGHEFVLDGYSGDMFYFNWGWDGQDNGWFNIQALAPDKDYEFPYDQSAVVGIQPARNGLTHVEGSIFFYSDDGGLCVTDGAIGVKNSIVKIKAKHVVNCTFGSGLKDIDGKTLELGTSVINPSLCLADKNGKIKAELSSLDKFLTIESGDGYNLTFEFNTSSLNGAVLGDKIILCYQTRSSSELIPVTANGSFVNSIPEAIAVYDFPMIDVSSDGYKAGDVLDLRIINIGMTPDVTWYFDGQEIPEEQKSVTLHSGTNTVKAVLKLIKGNGSDTVVRTETLIRKIIVK